MTSPEALFDLTRHAFWTAAMMATPVLMTALVVGLVIGLLQALTSVQEMTLTFVPKLIAMLAVFWLSLDFMTGELARFFTDEILTAVARG